jgi:hypothetical protein
VLGTLVLALDDDAGRDVGDADGRVRGVDMLAALAARAVGVDLDIVWVDADLDVLVDFGADENVCRLLAASKGEMRTRRWTPVSWLRLPKA